MSRHGCAGVRPLWSEDAPARLMVSGGGTGGHITPALALCEALRAHAPHSALWYIGRARSLEQRMARDAGVHFAALPAAPLRPGLWGLLRCAAVNLRGVIQACVLIVRVRPAAIVGFGGYVSFPLLLAGVCLRRTVIVHEANAVPGKTVRLLVRLGARLAYGLESGRDEFRHARTLRLHPERVCCTGNPLRRAFLDDLRAAPQDVPGLQPGVATVMVLGGSQGSRCLNTLAPQALRIVRAAGGALQAIHLAGAADEAQVRAAYADAGIAAYVAAFSERLGMLYRRADVVIARAGALSVSEICARGVPAVLVPFPHATDNHQHANAAVLAEHGAAVLLPEAELDAARLAGTVQRLLGDALHAAAMSAAARFLAVPDAAERLRMFIEQCLVTTS